MNTNKPKNIDKLLMRILSKYPEKNKEYYKVEIAASGLHPLNEEIHTLEQQLKNQPSDIKSQVLLAHKMVVYKARIHVYKDYRNRYIQPLFNNKNTKI